MSTLAADGPSLAQDPLGCGNVEVATVDLTVILDAGGARSIKALDSLTLLVRKSEFVAIVGRNGSGKSTLLRTIAGLQRPTQGWVYVGQAEVGAVPSYRRTRKVALVPQSPGGGCVPNLTVGENLYLAHRKGLRMRPQRAWSASSERKIFEALDQHAVPFRREWLTRYPAELSGGERQLVVMAMALLQQPSILLLDEHMAALDIHHSVQIRTLTEAVAKTGKFTILMVSHDLETAIAMAKRVLVLREGSCVKDSRNPSADEGEIRRLLNE